MKDPEAIPPHLVADEKQIWRLRERVYVATTAAGCLLGVRDSMQQGLRAIALLWNFHPYTYKVQRLEPYSKSPFEELNSFRYHDNWLRNLLIASSLNGRGNGKPIKPKLS